MKNDKKCIITDTEFDKLYDLFCEYYLDDGSNEPEMRIIIKNKIIDFVRLQNKELIEAYDEYIEFLGKELSRHEAFTVVRPYMAASSDVIDKGVELRAKIDNIKTNKK